MVFGISLGKFTSKQNLPWVLGGLAAGAGAYFILTGRDTGIGPIDTGLEFIGDNTGLEGVFPNSEPATLKPAPGKTTTVHTGASTNFAGDAFQRYSDPVSHIQFAGAGELSSFSEDGRLTIA